MRIKKAKIFGRSTSAPKYRTLLFAELSTTEDFSVVQEILIGEYNIYDYGEDTFFYFNFDKLGSDIDLFSSYINGTTKQYFMARTYEDGYKYTIDLKNSSDEVIETKEHITQTINTTIRLGNFKGNINLITSNKNGVVFANEVFDTRAIYYTDKDGTNSKNLIPSDEYVIEMFDVTLDNNQYWIIYTENKTQGKLYNLDTITNTIEEINVSSYLNTLYGKTTLSKTGKANATYFEQGFNDEFIFSNGEEVVYLFADTTTHNGLEVEDTKNIHLIDDKDEAIARSVYGLGLVVFDKRLWIFKDNVLWYSEIGNCREFRPTGSDFATDAGYIELVKNITAIYPYLGSLAVFHKDSSVLVQTDSTTRFATSDESAGGCASYRSLVFHGTELYFYDDTKKGVFSFQQVINGDKTLGENIALDLQKELLLVNKTKLAEIKALSVVTSDRNEIWFLLPIDSTYTVEEKQKDDKGEYVTVEVEKEASIILIYDYIRGEWVKRKCQKINTISIYQGDLYSGGKEIFEEYTNNTFNGDYINSYYTFSTFNYNADNTLKITKFPPRLTIDGTNICNFWCKYVKNYNIMKRPKIKEIKSKKSSKVLLLDNELLLDNGNEFASVGFNTVVKLPSATFKALEITLYTQKQTDNFAIKSLEMSRIKVKQV